MSELIQCKICLKEVIKKTFRQHLRQEHNTDPENYYRDYIYKSEPCKICGTPREMYRFISINKGCKTICRNPDCSENISCKICGKMFSINQLKSGVFLDHLETEHNINSLKYYYDEYIKLKEDELSTCDVCGSKRIYSGYINFIKGYEIVCENSECKTNKHKNKSKIGIKKDKKRKRKKIKTKDHKCEVCGEIITTHYTENAKFMNHLKEKHNLSFKEYDYKYIKKIDYMKCVICGDVFINRTYLNQHLQRVHDINTLELKKQYYDEHLKKEGDGVCVICGKPTKFYKLVYGYYDTCSKECMNKQRMESIKKTCIERYGTEHVFKTKEFIEKRLKNCENNDEYKKKLSEGIKAYWDKAPKEKVQQRSDKVSKTWNKKTEEEKEQVKFKRKQTIIERYGVDNYNKSEGFKNKLNDKEWVKKVQHKKYLTRKKNGTFKTSKPEKDLLLKLQSVYGDVKYQYRTKDYPFNCDFYLPYYDLYIELNAHWTHYMEAYDPCKIEHEKVLCEWGEKNTKFFKIAIKVWTESDVRKRETAKKNKLNYLE